MAFDLKTSYSRQKSFYGKAKIDTSNGKQTLYSYGTKVAEIENGKAKVYGLYSNTTTRHIKEFLMQNGFKVESSKQIIADYGVKNESKEEDKGDDSFKTIAMVAQMGEVFAKTKKEKNEWKLRMIKAGLGGKGFEMPSDWDKLSEDEKERRLDLVIKQLKGNK